MKGQAHDQTVYRGCCLKRPLVHLVRHLCSSRHLPQCMINPCRDCNGRLDRAGRALMVFWCGRHLGAPPQHPLHRRAALLQLQLRIDRPRGRQPPAAASLPDRLTANRFDQTTALLDIRHSGCLRTDIAAEHSPVSHPFEPSYQQHLRELLPSTTRPHLSTFNLSAHP